MTLTKLILLQLKVIIVSTNINVLNIFIIYDLFLTSSTVTSVAEHVKGEVVDNVGGLAKVIIHQQVATSDVFLSSSMMADYLDAKFKGSANPEYIVKEIGSSLFSPQYSPQQLAIVEGFTEANSVFTVITSAKKLPR